MDELTQHKALRGTLDPELDAINEALIEELEARAHDTAMARDHVKVTVQVGSTLIMQWVKHDEINAPAPPIDPPQLTRTVSNPNHLTWKAMDKRHAHRTGAPWHTCPNCTQFHTVDAHWAIKLVDANDPDFDDTDGPLTSDGSKRRVKEWREDHRGKFNKKGEPAPTTGMNLMRDNNTGQEWCTDCGWQGPMPDPAAPKPTRRQVSNRHDKAQAADRMAVILTPSEKALVKARALARMRAMTAGR